MLQVLARGIAGFQLQRPINVLGGRFHSIFSQIEPRKNQIGLGRLANAKSGFGLGASFASVAASVVVVRKGCERRGARWIDRSGVMEFGLGFSGESVGQEFFAEFDVKARV